MSEQAPLMRSKRLYQRQIPVLLASIIAGLLLAEYFTGYAPLTVMSGQIQLWATIMSLFIGLYATAITVILNIRRIARIKDARNHTFQASAVALGTLACFIIIGISVNATSALFTTLYTYVVLYATSATGLPWCLGGLYYVYRYMRPVNLESLVLFVFFLITFMRGMTVLVALWPPLYGIGYWLETVPVIGVTRAFVVSAAIGSTIMGIRVLVGREPGIMEVESVD